MNPFVTRLALNGAAPDVVRALQAATTLEAKTDFLFDHFESYLDQPWTFVYSDQKVALWCLKGHFNKIKYSLRVEIEKFDYEFQILQSETGTTFTVKGRLNEDQLSRNLANFKDEIQLVTFKFLNPDFSFLFNF